LGIEYSLAWNRIAAQISAARMRDEGVRSVVSMPLITHDRALGTLSLASLRDAAFQQGDVDYSFRCGQVAIAVENALAFQEIAELRNRLAQEKLYLEDEIRSEMNFEEIVAKALAARRAEAGRNRSAHRFRRAHPGGNRHGKGTDRPGDSQSESPARPHVCEGELRGHPRRLLESELLATSGAPLREPSRNA